MRHMVTAGLAALAAAGALALTAAPASAATAKAEAAACDANCLKGFVDQYMAALAARDPSKLPVTKTVRFTENTRPMPLGYGLWGTITKVGSYKHYFTDPKTGEVGYFGTVEEHGTPALFALRLKVTGRKIAEAETIVVRKQDMGTFLNTDRTLKPIWTEIVPPAQRLPRAELIRITNLYFEALEKDSGEVAPFADDCVRVENGVQTVNNPPPPPSAKPAPGGLGALGSMTCAQQIDTRIFSYITRIHPRRYVAVDEPHQSVLAIVMFHHNGQVTEVTGKDGVKRPMMASALRPFDVAIFEAFKIKDKKIREVEAVMTTLPYMSDTGWDK